MKKIILLLLLFITVNNIFAQLAKDSLPAADTMAIATAKAQKDSVAKTIKKAHRDSLEKALLAKSVYPLIKASKWSGVIPVSYADEKPDPTLQYKILMEVTSGIKDTTAAKEINDAFAEVGRIMNIHIAAGVPKKNLTVVVVAHGGVLRSFYNDSMYNVKYHINNPNTAILNEMLAAGVKFIACGQAMNFFEVDKKELMPWMKYSLSAQSVLTTYQLKGYVLKKIETE